jgi:hypothetical protein
MHFPELPLVACTICRLCSLEGILVNRFQREVEKDILYLALFDIFTFDLRERLTDVIGAEGSLKVGEFDQCDFGVFIALERLAFDTETRLFEFRRCGWRLLCAEKTLDLLKFLMDRSLTFLEGLDLILKSLKVFSALRETRLHKSEYE